MWPICCHSMRVLQKGGQINSNHCKIVGWPFGKIKGFDSNSNTSTKFWKCRPQNLVLPFRQELIQLNKRFLPCLFKFYMGVNLDISPSRNTDFSGYWFPSDLCKHLNFVWCKRFCSLEKNLCILYKINCVILDFMHRGTLIIFCTLTGYKRRAFRLLKT